MLPALALSLSFGYGIAAQTYTHSVPNPENGPELRVLWGRNDDHHDRWSAWLGHQPVRFSQDGVVQGARTDVLPGFNYVAILHRFNMRFHEHTTFFSGTGVGYRDLVTCVNGRWYTPGEPRLCIDGDPYVSSKWTFAQELGVRWRIVEFSIGHFSTGGISYFNKGENMVKFTLIGHVGHKEK